MTDYKPPFCIYCDGPPNYCRTIVTHVDEDLIIELPYWANPFRDLPPEGPIPQPEPPIDMTPCFIHTHCVMDAVLTGRKMKMLRRIMGGF